MKLNFRNLLILIFLIVIGKPYVVFGNDNLISYAIKFEECHNYESAITEYKRFIFLNPGHSLTAYCFYRMALDFRSMGRLDDACESFRTAAKLSHSDSLRDKARIGQVTTLIVSGNHSLARYQLLKMIHMTKLRSMNCSALFLQAINDIYLFDWSTAQEDFNIYYSECGGENYTGQETCVRPLLKNCTSLPYRSPQKAATLSTFLPGLGQAYVGYYWQGLNALILNSIIAVLTVDSANQRNYFDTALFLSLFVRFFSGNRHKAKELAEKRNLTLNRIHAQQILNKLATKH